MSFSKLTNDITFFNADGTSSGCTINGCRKKFKESTEPTSKTIKVGEFPDVYKTVEFNQAYHKCQDCGRLHRTKNDRSLTIEAYQRAKNKMLYGKEDLS